MDANKDVALECLDKAKHAMRHGDVEKARRMAEKSNKLFPTKEAEGIVVLNKAYHQHIGTLGLLAALNSEGRRPNGMGQGGSRDRPTRNVKTEQEETTAEPEYTSEQREAVNK